MSLLQRAISMSPDIDAQLVIIGLAAVLIKAQVVLVKKLAYTYSQNKPWFKNAVELEQNKMKTMMFIDADFDTAAQMWAEWWGIGLMHGIGGMFCIPAALGSTAHMSYALGRFGAAWEVGWEITDTLERLYQRFCLKDGHKLQPAGLLAFAFTHHALSMLMVLPMNMYFGTEQAYFQMLCLLLLAAWFPLWVGNYAQTLDVKKPSELRQMVICSAALFTSILGTRITTYWPIFFSLLSKAEEGGFTKTWYAGAITGGVLMPLIGLAFFADSTKRLFKFTRMFLGMVPVPGQKSKEDKDA